MQIPKVSNTRYPCFGCCCWWWWWWRSPCGLHTYLYHQNKEVVCSIYQGEKGQLSSGDQSWLITSASIALSSDLSAEQLAKEEPGPAGAISPTDHLEPAPGDNNRAGQVMQLKVSLFSILNRCYVVDIYFGQVYLDFQENQVKHTQNVNSFAI